MPYKKPLHKTEKVFALFSALPTGGNLAGVCGDLLVIFSVSNEHFATANNIVNIINQTATICILGFWYDHKIAAGWQHR